MSGPLLRAVAAGFAGAGFASIAQAAAPVPAFGPTEIVVFGATVPVWSALFGLMGVLLARRVAPPTPAEERLGRQGRIALTILLAIGVLALIIAGEKRPIVALAWSVGLGYSGLAFIQLVSTSVVAAAKLIMDGFAASLARAAGAWAEKKDPPK